MTTLQDLHARTLTAKITGLAEILHQCGEAADAGNQHKAFSLNETTRNPNLRAALIWLGLTWTTGPYPGASADYLIVSWRVMHNDTPVFLDAYLDNPAHAS